MELKPALWYEDITNKSWKGGVRRQGDTPLQIHTHQCSASRQRTVESVKLEEPSHQLMAVNFERQPLSKLNLFLAKFWF